MKSKIKNRIKQLREENQTLTNGYLILINNGIISELQKLLQL